MTNQFKTNDGFKIDVVMSRFHPDGPQDGMAPAMAYLWVRTPNMGWFKPNRTRSTLTVKSIVEENNLADLEFFITSGLV